MKRAFFSFILCAAAYIPVFGQETYTLFCSGTVQGTVTIERDRGGKITITGRLTGRFAPSVDINHAICPLIPVGVSLVFQSITRSIIIDGNTTISTNLDGSGFKRVVNGNTTTSTHSDGRVEKDVINGNTTTSTYSNGAWIRSVVNGNTTTSTFSNGLVQKSVVNGNTTTHSSLDLNSGIESIWYTEVVNGNTTTRNFPAFGWTKKVVDKQGHNIFITTTRG
jgi:hypothetical protein